METRDCMKRGMCCRVSRSGSFRLGMDVMLVGRLMNEWT